MRSLGLSLLAVSALVGCQQILGFETPSVLDAPSNPDLGDAGPCAEVSAQCLGDVLRACTTIGAPPVDTVCSWACGDEPQPHCLRLAPTGGGVTSDDLDERPGLEAVTVMSSVVIDGSLGTITGLREAGTGMRNGIGFEIRNNVGVFTFHSLQVIGTLTLRGTNAIALVAAGEIRVGALIDAQGACSATSAGPGGGNGGVPGMQETAPGSGGTGVDTNGGGGGGNGVAGGVGGSGTDNGPQTPRGLAFGTDTVVVLRGGGGGGAGGSQTTGGRGGGGGGAVQLVSNTSIDILSTIHAGGCGGNAAGGGGGGGGAGGTIVLEAPTVTVAASGLLAVNGGGGAGGAAGSLDGTDALAGMGAAGGGQGGGNGGGSGGAGGASAVLVGTAGMSALGSGGGGGGGVGRIRINTRTGTAAVAGTLSPSLGPQSTATVGLAVME